MPDVKTLKTFRMVASCGSFHAAAEALGVSVSTISLQMRNLEDFAGILLFDRSKKPPPLTAPAVDYLSQVDAVLNAWSGLEKLSAPSGPKGRLRLGAVHTTLAGIMPPALKSIRDNSPGLNVTVHLGLSHELEADLLAGRLDFAVLTTPEHGGGTTSTNGELDYHPIAEEPLVVIKNPSQPGEDALSCLSQNPIVRFSPKARVGQQIDALIAGIDGRSSDYPDMEIDTLESVVALVENGLGVAVVPMIAGASHLDHVAVLPLPNRHRRQLALAVPRTGPQIKLARDLLNVLRGVSLGASTT
ncbi:MAG: LysR family transcriptional regulator [Alphaproteobacteria bacterium]|nr:LysR family transcriptional regulator [Alphaproteobacteria bacterium]